MAGHAGEGRVSKVSVPLTTVPWCEIWGLEFGDRVEYCVPGVNLVSHPASGLLHETLPTLNPQP